MNIEIDARSLWRDVKRIRSTTPLVHNITNYVVMNNSANALLALGASPVMAHAEEEVGEMVKLDGALVINIGTLSPPWVRAMLRALQEARRLGIPVALGSRLCGPSGGLSLLPGPKGRYRERGTPVSLPCPDRTCPNIHPFRTEREEAAAPRGRKKNWMTSISEPRLPAAFYKGIALGSRNERSRVAASRTTAPARSGR